ncbi:MAG: hypothetical protein ACRC55_12585, partial [Plesiomonas sp.]
MSEQAAELPSRRLPFSFARRFGVILDTESGPQGADSATATPASEGQILPDATQRVCVYHAQPLGLEVLLELRRVIGSAFRLQVLD